LGDATGREELFWRRERAGCDWRRRGFIPRVSILGLGCNP
jgi:hypothetical protein